MKTNSGNPQVSQKSGIKEDLKKVEIDKIKKQPGKKRPSK
jgi:hypothetical protein